MKISLQINNVQHISTASFLIDVKDNKLTCVVGKNGAGKTTLIKAIRNLCSADTFAKTSSDNIFRESSKVTYLADDVEFKFVYDDGIRALNCHTPIPDHIKALIDVELPMPYGQRFNFFQSISNADDDIRKSIVLSKYTQPTELIEFMRAIYGTNKFDELVEIKVSSESYYCLPLEDSRYIREDYFSSGEYFLISLYRKIKGRCKLIVIDEIDISLDAAAQSRLIERLRGFCERYEVNILFTTHSLAMMRTLRDDELYYMEETGGATQIRPASYNYIKSMLFGFKGWDKYILTEDEELREQIEFLMEKINKDDLFFSYKVIPAGGADNVIDLMQRNVEENFLSVPENVITILDGDKKENGRVKRLPSIYVTPINNIESALSDEYSRIDFPYRLPEHVKSHGVKSLFTEMTKRHKVISIPQLHNYLYDKFEGEYKGLVGVLESFLTSKKTERVVSGPIVVSIGEVASVAVAVAVAVDGSVDVSSPSGDNNVAERA
ncbi:ATP-binding protein [Pseudomonas sp. SWRI74]|uniref:ATP-binding protein n=1 Tax=Pseudomonas azerbaijanoccidentalis TaxID=2842347 RepID=A0ABS6QMQ0_9PSED|nr:AAA family ATPase [Pseudomonas azerbaijanoccidentalis]MBV4520216.1 ATP-binding protein [Pseudomonas azerbaijanoccidentalis]